MERIEIRLEWILDNDKAVLLRDKQNLVDYSVTRKTIHHKLGEYNRYDY